MDQQNARTIGWILLAVLAGIVVSWLGLAALVALSILWPANQVLHVLLGVWLCVIAVYLGVPGGPNDNWPKRIVYAPLVGPILWVGLRARRALGL
jgi:apolipoprotein N-acyltransferase